MTFARISGLGQWFPETVRRNADWPDSFVEHSIARQGDRILVDIPTAGGDRIPAIIRRHLDNEAGDPFLGARERRIADPSVTSSQAEANAAQAALADAGLDAAEVDAIFSWAILPDRPMPSNACRVGDLIGATRAWGATVDLACASPVGQLALAAALVESGRARHVLLTQSHLLMKAFPMSHPASPSVGDGAAALVVSAAPERGVLGTHSVSHGAYFDSVVWARGRDDASDAPWWEAGGDFQLASRDPDGAKHLVQETVRMGVQTVNELLDSEGVGIDEISTFVSVQPRRWVPHAIAEALGLPQGAAVETFQTYGHLGGTGPVVNLLASRQAPADRADGLTLMYAQGAGFTRSAALLRL